MPKHFSTAWKLHYKNELNGMHEIVYAEAETIQQAVEKIENLYSQKPKFVYLYIERLSLIK